MKATIELDGVPLAVLPANYHLLPKDEVYSVCAWCDVDSKITNSMKSLGLQITHGICEHCARNQLQRINLSSSS